MAARGVRFVASDIWDAPDTEAKYEVIDGELYVSPPPVWRHQYDLSNLQFVVTGWVKSHQLGKVVSAPTGLTLNDENGIQPDLMFISNARAHTITEQGVQGAPDL